MYTEKELWIESKRGTKFPVSIIESNVENCPLVIFVHGFKADRHEGGRFTTVGRALAEKGISSIRMGFPGCDESTEDFFNYTLENCLSDIETSYKYMLDNYSIDINHLGMVGYSMGGRLTCLFNKNHREFKTIGLWAAAAYDGFEEGKFLGMDVIELKKQIEGKTSFPYFNSFDGTTLNMNVQLVNEIENCKPSEGLKGFEGKVIICHGDSDPTVLPKTVDIAISSLTDSKVIKKVIIEGANHGFGLWDDHMEQSKILTDETTEFFLKNL